MAKSELRMKDICRYIEEHQFTHRRTPTMAQIAKAVGTVQSNVYQYLLEMEQRGMINRRGREIDVYSTVPASTEINRAPILGKIACGQPEFEEEHYDEYIPLPVALFGRGDFFVLRARGDSMIDVGIESGDLVVVRKQNMAKEGDIVVALVDNETTLKRFYIDHQKCCIRLHPENKEMNDIFVKSCHIQGVAEHVIKTI